MITKRSPGRKLLVASLGVAAVSYVGCGTTASTTTSKDAAVGQGKHDAPTAADVLVGNLAPPPADAHMVVGNLVAPPGIDSGMDAQMVVGNLVAPPSDASMLDAQMAVGNLGPPPMEDAAADAHDASNSGPGH